MKTSARAVLSCALLTVTCLSGPASAQEEPVTTSPAPSGPFAAYICVSAPADMAAAEAARARGLPSPLVPPLIHYEAGRAAGLPTCEG